MESLANCKNKYRKLKAFWERYRGLIKTVGYGLYESESKCVDFGSGIVLTDEGVFLRMHHHGVFLPKPTPIQIARVIRVIGSQDLLIAAIRKSLIERIDKRLRELPEEMSSLRDYRAYLDGSW